MKKQSNMKAIIAMVFAVIASTTMLSCMNDSDTFPDEAKDMQGIYQGMMEVTSDYGDTTIAVHIQLSNALSIKPMPLVFMLKPFVEVNPESEIGKELSDLTYASPYAVSVNDTKDSVFVFVPTTVSNIPIPLRDKYHQLEVAIGGADMQTVYSVKNKTLNLVLKSREAVYDNVKQNSYKGVTMTVKNARKLIGEQ